MVGPAIFHAFWGLIRTPPEKRDQAAIKNSQDKTAAAALAGIQGKPIAAMAFDCAGRKGKLKKIEEELAAIQQAVSPGGTIVMPTFSATRRRASGKERVSIIITNLKTSPPTPQPKQWKICLVGWTANDGVFS